MAAKPDLARILPNQCVIQTAGKLFNFPNDGIKRGPWFGNLYLRLARQPGQNGTLIEWTAGPKSQLWMTNVTLQGDGKENSNGINARAAPILMAGALLLSCEHCTIASLSIELLGSECGWDIHGNRRAVLGVFTTNDSP
jgi:hypothetical protein